ncbi:uncharacterized protein LOC110432178 isoform X2 [Sorghum bicolor]|uniref:uncharacterized protein LOC110432178 isoform X2 n=1 Tax=Sorghum bicolor TaxID=4558 RepID=UPI00081AB9DA|nr:uncharacterized protein LOC110432178 isoform X2 [Sorghum bicolor]|eukprot:XP_021307802.1 uncharacterized protein LOC110432178 isoform X2 [Sorghum bicolor]
MFGSPIITIFSNSAPSPFKRFSKNISSPLSPCSLLPFPPSSRGRQRRQRRQTVLRAAAAAAVFLPPSPCPLPLTRHASVLQQHRVAGTAVPSACRGALRMRPTGGRPWPRSARLGPTLYPPIDLRALIRGRLTNPSCLFLAGGGASPRRSALGAVPVARVAALVAGAPMAALPGHDVLDRALPVVDGAAAPFHNDNP